MKKFFMAVLSGVLTCLSLSGCGKEKLPDSYVEGSDYQYMYEGQNEMSTQARGEHGMYYWIGKYVYYLDTDKNKLVPLCNKADCLHDRETDEEKQEECNAYLSEDETMCKRLMYCKGYLYGLVNESENDKEVQQLCRLKEDGSERDTLYQWDQSEVHDCIVHRGMLYYTENINEIVKDKNGEEQNRQKFSIKCLPLKQGRAGEAKTIFEPEDGLTVYTMQGLKAYGNHFYFMMDADKTTDPEEVTADNYLDYYYLKYWEYNIETEKVSELTLPNPKQYEFVETINFWKDKLILMPGYRDKICQDAKADVYLTNLDGSEPGVLFQDVDTEQLVVGDDKYLYQTNAYKVNNGRAKEVIYEVYDENRKKIDLFCMPDGLKKAGYLGIGDPDTLSFMIYTKDGKKAKIMSADKKKFGTYQGSELDIKIIAETPLSEANLIEQE